MLRAITEALTGDAPFRLDVRLLDGETLLGPILWADALGIAWEGGTLTPWAAVMSCKVVYD